MLQKFVLIKLIKVNIVARIFFSSKPTFNLDFYFTYYSAFSIHHSCYICKQNTKRRMLQVNFIKTNREEVLKGLATKHFAEISLVDTIISLDDERKKLQFELLS